MYRHRYIRYNYASVISTPIMDDIWQRKQCLLGVSMGRQGRLGKRLARGWNRHRKLRRMWSIL